MPRRSHRAGLRECRLDAVSKTHNRRPHEDTTRSQMRVPPSPPDFFDQRSDRLNADRLADERINAWLFGFMRGWRHSRHRGENDDVASRGRGNRSQLTNHFEPSDVRQVQVAQDQVRPEGRRDLQRFVAGQGRPNIEPCYAQKFCHPFGQIEVVLDQQHPNRRSVFCRPRRAGRVEWGLHRISPLIEKSNSVATSTGLELSSLLVDVIKPIQITLEIAADLADAIGTAGNAAGQTRGKRLRQLDQGRSAMLMKQDRAYEDFLGGRLSKAFWTRKSNTWEAELRAIESERARVDVLSTSIAAMAEKNSRTRQIPRISL